MKKLIAAFALAGALSAVAAEDQDPCGLGFERRGSMERARETALNALRQNVFEHAVRPHANDGEVFSRPEIRDAERGARVSPVTMSAGNETLSAYEAPTLRRVATRHSSDRKGNQ